MPNLICLRAALLVLILVACTSDPPARVDSGVDGSMKDASMDATPDAEAPDSKTGCSDSNACTDRSNARCNAGACEQCTDHSHCEQFSSSPVCSGGKCIECAGNAQCDSPLASRCFAGSCTRCESDGDCSHIPGKGVCHENQCVQCTSEKDAACTGVCVIEPLTDQQSAFTCDDSIEVGKTLPCVPCVSSKQCLPGAFCVAMTEGENELGNYCLWDRDSIDPGAPAGTCQRPYGDEVSVDSVEGNLNTTFCTPSITTCRGLTEARSKSCDETLEKPMLDGQCGHPDVEGDSFCVQVSGEDYRCTVPCIGDTPQDCPTDLNTCSAPPKGRSDIPTQKVCTL